jgi:hypothetical protein
MMTHAWRYGAPALIAYALLSPSEASAGVVLITWGDTVSHLGNVSPQIQETLPARKVGFKSSSWGLFWIDLWTWGGEYCVYDGQRYWRIPRAEAARLLGKPESELGMPLLYRVPLGWLILGPLMVVWILAVALEKRKRTGIGQLFQDPNYQCALGIIHEQYGKHAANMPGAADQESEERIKVAREEKFRTAFEAGVQHLVDVGIARKEAERNLTLMVQALANTPPSQLNNASYGSCQVVSPPQDDATVGEYIVTPCGEPRGSPLHHGRIR